MTAPVRIQRQRSKGWKMPPNTVYVGRPTEWGNPYRVGDIDPVSCEPMDAYGAVFWFDADLDPMVSDSAAQDRAEIRSELRGKNLACWCRLDQPCHADVLLKIANEKRDVLEASP